MIRLVRNSDKTVIAEKCRFARSIPARILGMIGRRFARSSFDALVFERCNAVHCCWMIEAIDVLFLSEDLVVTKVCSRVKPWCFAWGGKDSKITVELPAGSLKRNNIVPGDRLEWK